MSLNEIIQLIESRFPDVILETDNESTPQGLKVEHKEIKTLCAFLKDHEMLFFDSLSCLTGIDNGEEAGTMEVIYNLYSIPNDLHLMLKAGIDRIDPVIDSVADIWMTADWHEREAYDLLGIKFEGHPDLRRILLPNDWEGFPLRKDYKHQERYHGITVAYEDN
jgi:NADH-quinone oxidoreductase subunit C